MANYTLTTGDDTLNGVGNEADYFAGPAGGVDFLHGEGGDDFFQLGAGSAGEARGGAGVDTVTALGTNLGTMEFLGVEILALSTLTFDTTVDQLSAFDSVHLNAGPGTVITLSGAGGVLYFTDWDGSSGAVLDASALTSGLEVNGSVFDEHLTGTDFADRFELYNGGGDTVIAGDGDDEIYLDPSQLFQVDGGLGADLVELESQVGPAVVTLAEDALIGVETLNLNGDLSVATADGNVAAGETMTVFAHPGGSAINFYGGAELDGAFVIYAETGQNTIQGGAGNDVFHVGSDDSNVVTTGDGSDTLFITALSGSFGPFSTQVSDFQTGAGGDKFDFSEWFGLGVLDGWDGVEDLFAAGYLSLVQINPDDVELQVDVDAGGSGAVAHTLFVLNGAHVGDFTSENFDIGVVLAEDDAGSATEAGGVNNLTPGSNASGDVLANDIGNGLVVSAVASTEVAPSGGEHLIAGAKVSSVEWLDGGDFVVVSTASDGAGDGIFARRFDASGTAVGAAFQINQTVTGSQTSPGVTALADGGFLVLWDGDATGADTDVFGRIYNADGTAQTPEFTVNTLTAHYQGGGNACALADGGFVVTWGAYYGEDEGGFAVKAQRFDAAGVKVGPAFLVNTFGPHGQNGAQITALGDGGWFIAWTSNIQDGSESGIYGQRYDQNGLAVGGEVHVSTTTQSTQLGADVAGLADGGWVVSWTSYNQDGSSSGIFAQRYDSSGAAAGGEFQVNTFTAGPQDISRVTAAPDGGFLITWNSRGQDGSGWGVYGQAYDAEGQEVGQEFRLNDTVGGHQQQQMASPVSIDASGRIVAVWSDGANSTVQLFDGETAGAVGGTTQGAYGLLTLNADGSYSYAVDNANAYVQALRQVSDTLFDVFTYTVDDGEGGTAEATLTITVHGQNDAPTMTGGIANVGVREDDPGFSSTFAYLGASDPDTGDVLSVDAGWTATGDPMVLTKAGVYGLATWDRTTGKITYQLNNSDADTNALSTGDTVTDAFTIIVTDLGGLTATKTVTFTIKGANESIDGTGADDDIVGTAFKDWMHGLAGDDELSAKSGADVVFGDEGDDLLNGGSGNDTLVGSADDDRLLGGSGADSLLGGEGEDVLIGGSGDDILMDDVGPDTLRGGGGSDLVIFANATAGINLSLGSPSPDADGNLLTSIERVIATKFTDYVAGTNAANFFDGLDGADALNGYGGDDTLLGGGGKDTLYGGLGKDILRGDGGADLFDFNDKADSGLGVAADVIVDFSHAQGDRIDLLNAYGGVLVYVGAAAFSGGGVGQVRVVTAGPNQMVSVDTNGDGVADMQILVSGGGVTGAGDFVL